MTYVTRRGWGAAPAKPGPGRLTTSRVRGVALHWPAMARPLRGRDAVVNALRGWQRYHQAPQPAGKGWSDIAYQEAIDQDGVIYRLRGLDVQSGANGNADVNEEYGALLLILAPDEEPTIEMIRAVRRRIRRHRELFPHSTEVVGHGQIRPEPTACPGPAAQRHIDAGHFDPAKPYRPVRRPR